MKYILMILVIVSCGKPVTSEQEYMACMYGANMAKASALGDKIFRDYREVMRKASFDKCIVYKGELNE